MNTKPLHTVLITRPLDEARQKFALQLGLQPLIREAITIRFPDKTDTILKTVSANPDAPWIFTSQKAVKAIKKVLNSGKILPQPPDIYAVGDKTKNTLQKLGLHAKTPETKQHAEGLAGFILRESASDTFIYFCGSRTLGTIQKELKDHSRSVIETEVYETVLQPVELPDEPVEAILFYSPSAVEAFAKGNSFSGNLPHLFAIGPTTATAIQQRTSQTVFTSPKPDTDVFLKYVSQVLKNKR